MSKIKEFITPIALISSIFIFSVAVVIAAIVISKTEFEIKDKGSTKTQNGTISNTVQVNGVGTITSKPDTANIDITVRETGKNTSDAQDKVSKQVNGLISFLKKQGISKDDIKTNRYNIYPTNQWRDEAEVRQSLDIKIRNIDKDEKKLGRIVEAVTDYGASSDWWYGWNINYDIEDKTPLYSQARELAYAKCLQKGEELSDLAKVKLDKPISISESSRDSFTSKKDSNTNYALETESLAGKVTTGDTTTIPTGEMEVSVTLNVAFEID